MMCWLQVTADRKRKQVTWDRCRSYCWSLIRHIDRKRKETGRFVLDFYIVFLKKT